MLEQLHTQGNPSLMRLLTIQHQLLIIKELHIQHHIYILPHQHHIPTTRVLTHQHPIHTKENMHFLHHIMIMNLLTQHHTCTMPSPPIQHHTKNNLHNSTMNHRESQSVLMGQFTMTLRYHIIHGEKEKVKLLQTQKQMQSAIQNQMGILNLVNSYMETCSGRLWKKLIAQIYKQIVF